MKKITFTIIGISCVIFFMSACSWNVSPIVEGKSEPESSSDLSKRHATFGSWGIQTKWLSETIEPGDDFYEYVNDGWLKTTQIPPGYASFSGANALALTTQEQTQELFKEVVGAKHEDGTLEQRIGDLYASYINVSHIEELGLTPIQDDLNRLLIIESHEEVARWMADPRSHSIVGAYAWLDSKDTSQHVLHIDQQDLDQGIFGMPNSTYYISEEEPYTGHRVAYKKYIQDTLQRAGIDRPEERALQILEIETAIANQMWTPSKLRDREANYNAMSVDELLEYAPGFPWVEFLNEQGYGDARRVILGTDTAVRATAGIFESIPVDSWSSYLIFHWIDNHFPYLPKSFSDAGFNFHARTLYGVEERSALGVRAMHFVNRHLGQEIGQLYVERYFSEAYRDEAEKLVNYLRRAFEERLTAADWMDAETRIEALNKLATMEVTIGYPKVWRNVDDLVIKEDDLIGNYQRLLNHKRRLNLAKFGKGYPDGEWWMNPHTVDAAFSPQLNRITIPAGILQPPFFDPKADPAVNFGAIGAVIGHEMGHGFDDQGSRFDSHGHIRPWWTDHSRENFEKRASGLVQQYNNFSPLPGIVINGEQTLGENIGDLTGISVGYRAYELFVEDTYSEAAPVLDGFSGPQRFFLAWAQASRTLWTDEALRRNALHSYHPPGRYRVNGVMRNIDEWYEAFNVEPAHELYIPKDERVRLW